MLEKVVSLQGVKQLNTYKMKTTTDLMYQQQKVLNAVQELLLDSKKHVDFLATKVPEIRENLESIAENLQVGVYVLEKIKRMT